MLTLRCPVHDVLFDTETDHTKPGTRELDSESKPTGKHRHPLFKRGTGVLPGHPDCPLCKKAIKNGDPDLVVEDPKPAAAASARMRVGPPSTVFARG